MAAPRLGIFALVIFIILLKLNIVVRVYFILVLFQFYFMLCEPPKFSVSIRSVSMNIYKTYGL